MARYIKLCYMQIFFHLKFKRFRKNSYVYIHIYAHAHPHTYTYMYIPTVAVRTRVHTHLANQFYVFQNFLRVPRAEQILFSLVLFLTRWPNYSLYATFLATPSIREIELLGQNSSPNSPTKAARGTERKG